MPSTFAAVSEPIRQLARSIDTQGYACIESLLSHDDLTQLRAFTDQQAQRHAGEYFACHGEQALAGCSLLQMCSSPTLQQLLADLYCLAAGQQSVGQSIFPVLRCVQGNQGRRESNCFHFDASLVTVLIPIYIPDEGQQRGDLMMFPNLRSASRSLLVNVLHKMLLQNAITRSLLAWAIRLGWLKPLIVQLVPGSIYLFWGYRSLHANQPCSPGVIRATAILHFGDPHHGSLITRLIRRITERRAMRVSAQALRPDASSARQHGGSDD
ncbi:hypothetical protein NJC40_17110 [Pseudomonas sp. 21LCFQ02]|uniref:hypothetical protein n=1 Tax=unclassified Pseudomonas TaxID=196821 RepID=UPI0004F7346D|nr:MULTISPECIES: hypothetical protein [unclassified Pseudomonas]MCO8169486.1 hypothetical protein [Pseudomonas sp. 21LCFQ02]BAP46150.1 putative uncharacterized protein [Pseudomonas sp. StFLB209]